MAISQCHRGLLRITEHRLHFDVKTSVHELLELGQTVQASNERNLRYAQERYDGFDGRPGWFGMSMDRCLNLRDYPEGLALAENYRKQLPTLHAAGIKRVPTWANDGDEFCRDRFDAGIEDCWRTRRRGRAIVNKPILRLTCEIGGSWKLTAEQLAWSGAVAFAVCDAAEEAGYQMEIDCLYQGTDVFTTGKGIRYSIACKTAGEPLDRETAIIGLACPAFFRWHAMQSVFCITPDGKVEEGIGCVDDSRENHGDLHIARCTSASAAAREAQRLMAQIQSMAQGGAQLEQSCTLN